MRIGLLIASLVFLATAAAATGSALSITRAMYIERGIGSGVALEPADRLRTGDKVVMVMQWNAAAQDSAFTLASRVPPALAFQRSGRENVEVSVDGGQRWGRIGSLRIGSRLAAPEDVTDLRWRIPSRDGSGMLTYSAVVR